MIIPAYFHEAGVPKTGLSPTIDIYRVSDDALVVNDGAMTEVGEGFYKYDFAGYSSAQDYMYVVDGTATLANGYRYLAGATDVDGSVAKILVDTGNTLDTKLDVIDDFLDTELAAITAAVITNAAGVDIAADIIALKAETAAILEDTGTTLPTTIDALPTAAEIQAEMEENGASLLDTIRDTLGAAGAGLTAVPWNAAWDAEVESEATDALNAYDPPTKTELDTGLDALPTAAEIKAAVEGAGGHLALILADTNELQTDWHDGGRLDLLLDAAGSAGDPWTTALPGVYGAGTAGRLIGDNINAPIATVDTVVDAIKAKTDNLPADPADQSAVEAAITAATSPLATAVAVADLPTNAELTSSLAAADDAVLAAIAALNNLSAAGAQAAAAAALAAYGAALQTSVDDLESRLTATRAGYLDNLSGGAVATAAAVAALPTTAQINAEVVDALNVDTYAEPGQEAPGATQTIRKMLQFLYKSWRNKGTQTATELKLYSDNGLTVDQKATVSDDAVTFTREKMNTGA